MTIYNRRSIPHPILSPISQDYRKEFTFKGEVVKINADPERGRIIVALRYSLNEPKLEELIRDGNAQFTTVAHCLAGRSRECRSTGDTHHEIELKHREYTQKLDIQSFITAARDLEKLHSTSWNPEITRFLPQGIPIPEGAILAISDPSNCDLEEAKALESCVSITPSKSVDPGEFNIDLEEDLIRILVNPEDREKLNRARNGHQEPFLWPSIYLNAIQQAVQEHRMEHRQERQWARVIRRSIEDCSAIDQTEFDADEDGESALSARSLVYAQKLMNQPMRRLIQEDPNG